MPDMPWASRARRRPSRSLGPRPALTRTSRCLVSPRRAAASRMVVGCAACSVGLRRTEAGTSGYPPLPPGPRVPSLRASSTRCFTCARVRVEADGCFLASCISSSGPTGPACARSRAARARRTAALISARVSMGGASTYAVYVTSSGPVSPRAVPGPARRCGHAAQHTGMRALLSRDQRRARFGLSVVVIAILSSSVRSVGATTPEPKCFAIRINTFVRQPGRRASARAPRLASCRRQNPAWLLVGRQARLHGSAIARIDDMHRSWRACADGLKATSLSSTACLACRRAAPT